MGYSLIGTFQQISLRSPPTTNTPTFSPPVWISPEVLPVATHDESYSYQLEATDPQSESITYTLNSETTYPYSNGVIPSGLSVTADGLIHGTIGPFANVALPYVSSFAVTVKDTSGYSSTRFFTITVN